MGEQRSTEEEMEDPLLTPVESGEILSEDQPDFKGLIPVLAALCLSGNGLLTSHHSGDLSADIAFLF